MSKQKIELTFDGKLHTFNCVANQNPLVRVFLDTSPGPMVLANRITEQFRLSDNSNAGTRLISRISLPVAAALSANSPTGYVLPQKAAGENRAIIQVDISKFSDRDQVDSFAEAIQAYVASDEFITMISTQMMC